MTWRWSSPGIARSATTEPPIESGKLPVRIVAVEPEVDRFERLSTGIDDRDGEYPVLGTCSQRHGVQFASLAELIVVAGVEVAHRPIVVERNAGEQIPVGVSHLDDVEFLASSRLLGDDHGKRDFVLAPDRNDLTEVFAGAFGSARTACCRSVVSSAETAGSHPYSSGDGPQERSSGRHTNEPITDIKCFLAGDTGPVWGTNVYPPRLRPGDMIRSFEGAVPEIAESAYVDGSAVVIGDVVLEPETSVWPGAVLRGDHGRITLREGANVQDNATLHEGTEIGPSTTVGHNAIVHAAETGERSMVGMGAIVLDGAIIGEEAIVAANSVVTEGTAVPARTLVAGAPAEPVKELDDTGFAAAADRYVENARRHGESSEVLERGTVRPGETFE